MSDEPTTHMAVSVEQVSVTLGNAQVLDTIDFAVDPGTLVGLVGPNGAGKTTLLRTINGALTPDQGAVRVGGQSVHELSSKATSRRVATVPQETSLSFDFTVSEVVAMGRTPHLSRLGGMAQDDHDIVERAMERTSVTELADRPITEVSGGERSRVLLARALAQDAPVLVLDEPTASLDINHQLQTLELVRELADEGRTVLAAIHDLNLAARYCDALVLLSDGEVLATGPPENVLSQTGVRTAFDTEAALARAPETGTRRVTALTDMDDEETGHVHVVGGEGRATRFLHPLVAAGYDVTLGPVPPRDPDAEAAEQLGVECLTLPPYAGVDEAVEASLREILTAADTVLVADVGVSQGNLPVFDTVAGHDRIVLVEDTPFAERNHAGEAGRQHYDRLSNAAVEAPPAEALDAVQHLITCDEAERTTAQAAQISDLLASASSNDD